LGDGGVFGIIGIFGIIILEYYGICLDDFKDSPSLRSSPPPHPQHSSCAFCGLPPPPSTLAGKEEAAFRS
jgi:hypothetical protein